MRPSWAVVYSLLVVALALLIDVLDQGAFGRRRRHGVRYLSGTHRGARFRLRCLGLGYRIPAQIGGLIRATRMAHFGAAMVIAAPFL